MKSPEAAGHDDERIRTGGQRLAFWMMEGAVSDRENLADTIEFALGDLTADEVVRRARRRYGLEALEERRSESGPEIGSYR